VSEISAASTSLRRVVFCCFAKTSAEHHIAVFGELGLG